MISSNIGNNIRLFRNSMRISASLIDTRGDNEMSISMHSRKEKIYK